MVKYKAEILFFTIISIILVLFPPIMEEDYDEGYSFLFTIQGYYTINYVKLILEIVFIGLVTVLFHYTKNYLKSLLNKISMKGNSLAHFINTVILGLILISIIVLFNNYYEDIMYLTKPNSLSFIPNKYPEEIKRFNEGEGLGRIFFKQSYYYSDYNIFKMVLSEDKFAIMKFYLPSSSIPDISPYLIDEKPKYSNIDKHSFWGMIQLREDYLPLSDNDLSRSETDRIHIKNIEEKTLTKEKRDLYFANYKSLKNEYLNTVKADAKTYVDDYHNFTWRQTLRIPLTILLSILSFVILFIRFKKII
ncbi:MAG TPA: hypothetical protein VIH28_10020 [Ignavibacteriaceae bacterium]